MGTVTWLHLSDLHTGTPSSNWDFSNVVSKLIDDLQKMEKTHGLCPDLLFFTGDLVWGNDPKGTIEKQFISAQKFIEKVRTAFTTHIPKTNIFIVPGNHEINRVMNLPADESYMNSLDVNTAYLHIDKADKQWRQFMKRLRAYRDDFLKKFYNHLITDEERLLYAEIVEINNVQVGIGGFNSAWPCYKSGKSEGGLLIGAGYQLQMIEANLRESDFQIALIHHPPNWFNEKEDKAFMIMLQEKFKFCLHGHEHLSWPTILANGHTTISSGACYQRSEKSNGYNFVRLDLEKCKGEVWLRRYNRKGSAGWVPEILPENKSDNNGKVVLNNTNWMRTISGLKSVTTTGQSSSAVQEFYGLDSRNGSCPVFVMPSRQRPTMKGRKKYTNRPFEGDFAPDDVFTMAAILPFFYQSGDWMKSSPFILSDQLNLEHIPIWRPLICIGSPISNPVSKHYIDPERAGSGNLRFGMNGYEICDWNDRDTILYHPEQEGTEIVQDCGIISKHKAKDNRTIIVLAGSHTFAQIAIGLALSDTQFYEEVRQWTDLSQFQIVLTTKVFNRWPEGHTIEEKVSIS